MIVEKNKKLLIGYVGKEHLKNVTDADAKNLDGINIAFAKVENNCVVYDDHGTKEEIVRLTAINPSLKFLISVGGWGAGNFSEAAYTDEARKTFAKTTLEWVNKLGLAGIDLDWEYPCDTGAGISGCKEDKQNFTLLLKELRETFDRQDKTLLLTIAAGGTESYLKGVEAQEIIKYLDYIQLMTYDLRGASQLVTGHHTNVFESKFDSCRASVDSAVKDFMAAGIPAEKLVIGAAFYSRIWTGVPNDNNGLIQMGKTPGVAGPNYGELVENYINKNGYTRHWDDSAKAPYLYNGDAFISYDDEESIAHKVTYAKDNNLLGLMYWQYSSDSTKTLTGVLRKEIETNSKLT